VTVAEVIARTRYRLDESLGSSSLRYTTAALTQYVTDGIRQFVAFTGNQYATTTITQTANTLLYDLPCDCIQVEGVTWTSSSAIPLEVTTPRELDRECVWWQRSAGTRAQAYFVLGLKRIALWPTSTAGGESYVVYYKQDKYSGIDLVPKEDHECLVNYTLARCLLVDRNHVDGGKEFLTFRNACERTKKRRASMDRAWSMGR